MAGLPQLQRLLPRRTPKISFLIDGQAAEAFEGESLLLAILSQVPRLRLHEVDDAPRAGFCLMGACQDCWVWTADGRRLRACTTPVAAGMSVLTRPPSIAHG